MFAEDLTARASENPILHCTMAPRSQLLMDKENWLQNVQEYMCTIPGPVIQSMPAGSPVVDNPDDKYEFCSYTLLFFFCLFGVCTYFSLARAPYKVI